MDTPRWTWIVGTIQPFTKCADCARPLREASASGVLEWTDGQKYHVHCLLNKLAEPSSAAATPLYENGASYWPLTP